MNKELIKQTISNIEFFANGFDKLCGSQIKVINLKSKKDKYIADIILISEFGEIKERVNNCEYNKELINSNIKEGGL